MHTPCSTKGIVKMCVRIGVGLALAFTGIAHYRDPALYAEFVGRGLGPLEQAGMVWGYILPALFIIGGLLLAINKATKIAAYALGIGLASIPAGLMLKSAITGIPVDQTMPNAVTGLVWIVALLLCIKGSCGMGGGCCGPVACAPGCNCPGCGPKGSMPTPVAKSAPAAPAVTKKPAVKKKAPAKKMAPAKKKPAAKKKK